MKKVPATPKSTFRTSFKFTYLSLSQLVNMQLLHDSELMLAQKHAESLSAIGGFQALQTTDGHAVFFSIGTDGVFYCSREVPGTTTGWSRIDLSSGLSKRFHGGNKITAKCFAVSQNTSTLHVDIALVVSDTTKAEDHLYVSFRNLNSGESWAAGVIWSDMAFDAPKRPGKLTIADVYMMDVGNAQTTNFWVDVQRYPSNSLAALDRYYIDISRKTPATSFWNLHTLAVALKAGSIQSCPGNRKRDFVPGIYTFGSLGGDGASDEKLSLIYAPQINAFRPNVPPNPTRLKLPDIAGPKFCALASALNSAGETNLFISGKNGLYLYTPDNQHEKAEPVLAVPSSESNNLVASNVTSLHAATVASRTVVWGINTNRVLFHVSCPAGQEAQASAWSTPTPLLSGVENFSFFVNSTTDHSVLFARRSGQQGLVQLTQDPATTMWTPRPVMLQTESLDQVLEYNSFTTHVTAVDDNGVPQPDTALTITAANVAPIYINNVYYVLGPSTPVQVSSDELGQLTVVQQSGSLAAVPFQVAISSSTGVVADVDPLTKARAKLQDVKDGDGLAGVQIKTKEGAVKPLVPSNVDATSRDAIAKSIAQLAKIDSQMNTAARKKRGAPNDGEPVAEPPSFGISFASELAYHEGEDVLKDVFGGSVSSGRSTRVVESISGALSVAVGDLFSWLASAWREVSGYVVKKVDDAWNFVCRLGDALYRVVLDSVQAVMGAVEFVLKKIGVFFEDLVSWLGFLFDWDDILRTHSAMKALLKIQLDGLVASVGSIKQSVTETLDGLSNQITAWADVQPSGQTIGALEKTGSGTPGFNSPQANWATQHFKNGADAAKTSALAGAASEQDLERLRAAGKDANTGVLVLADQLEALLKQLPSLDPVQAIKQILALTGALVLQSAKALVTTLLDIVQSLVQTVIDGMDAAIDIPVLSWLYKKITKGSDLSVLDLVCLVTAVPATVLYKLAAGRPPYPDDASVKGIVEAKSVGALKDHLSNKNGRTTRSVGQAEDDTLTAVTNFASAIGAIQLCILTRINAPPWVRFAFELVYAAPDFTWPIVESDVNPVVRSYGSVFCGLDIFGKFLEVVVGERGYADAMGPGFDLCISTTLLIVDATYFAKREEPEGIDRLALAADVLGYVAEVCKSVGDLADDKKVKAAAIAGSVLLRLGFAGCAVGVGALAAKDAVSGSG